MSAFHPIANSFPRSVGVIGGGTSGYFAALALKRRFPRLNVTIVESREVPIIGVGEATTTLMPPFLHAQLGLDVVELFQTVKPTLKLGIKFEWGLPDPNYYFTYPFGDADPIEACAFDGHVRNQSLSAMLMSRDRAPLLREPDGRVVSLLSRLKFAYHLDNAPFVAFLAKASVGAGIGHEVMTIASVATRSDGHGVSTVRGTDGRELQFDFYIDATGFRSLLLEQTLGSTFVSYASSLFCDRAIVAAVAQREGVIRPYTTAETMDAGWCWRIPLLGEDHRGYVHSSAFLSEEAALAEMRAKIPGLGEPRTVGFRSGRRRDFWIENTAGIGNAYGFVEPLESTALHMVIVEIGYLIAGLEGMERGDDTAKYVAFVNGAIGSHWDFLRWFLAIHYRFNRRRDTEFWRAARAGADTSGLAAVIERFHRDGPWVASDGERFQTGDPAFGFSGAMLLLLGQHVGGPIQARGNVTRPEWDERVAKLRALADRALPQREALAILGRDPALLSDFASAPSSWCGGDTDRVDLAGQDGRMVHPRSGGAPFTDALEPLLRSIR